MYICISQKALRLVFVFNAEEISCCCLLWFFIFGCITSGRVASGHGGGESGGAGGKSGQSPYECVCVCAYNCYLIA